MKFMCRFFFAFAVLIFAFCFFPRLQVSAAPETSLKPGEASGSLSVGEKSIKLSYATAFVDGKEEGKPVVLLVTDQAVPSSNWKDSSEMIMYRMDHKFGGVAFWLDEKRQVFRTEYYAGTFPTGASGVFELKLDNGAGKSLAGSAHSTDFAAKLESPVKLEVRFNASLK